jgi:hypothetical protein
LVGRLHVDHEQAIQDPVSEYFYLLYKLLQDNPAVLMEVCYSVGRLDFLKPEFSKHFFAYRITHAGRVPSDASIQTFGITPSQRDSNSRKLQYQEVLDSVEAKEDLLEVVKMISKWSDVQILKNLLKDRIELITNQIHSELSKEKFTIILDKFVKIKKLSSALYQIHHLRQDFRECYLDMQLVFFKLAKLFTSRKDQLVPEVRKALFKLKLIILNLIISEGNLGLPHHDYTLIDPKSSTLSRKSQFDLKEYFKALGYPNVMRDWAPKLGDFAAIRTLVTIVAFFHPAHLFGRYSARE